MLKRVQALNVYEREVDVCVPATPERMGPSSFRLNRRERFLFCSSVTQPVREMRATLVGNTLLGNTVAPTYIKEDRMPKSAFYTLTWSSSSQAYELYSGQGDDVLDR